MIYLDHNATTPLDPRVLDAMLPFFKDKWGNASSRDHAYGWDASEAVEEARAHVAALINAREHEIVFTSGATESIRLFVEAQALQRTPARSPEAPAAMKTARSEGLWLTSAVEHSAMLDALRRYGRPERIRHIGVDAEGALDMKALERGLAEGARLLFIMAANNETGGVFPIRACAERARAHGALLFTDAAQALGKIPLDAQADGFDAAAFSAHKLGGPKGAGALYIRGGREGGLRGSDAEGAQGSAQEAGLRAGTLNVPGIAGFGEACRIAKAEMAGVTSRLRKLRDRLEAGLIARHPGIRVNGGGAERLANTANVLFPGTDARALIRDMHAVAASTRAACSSGSSEASHVLKAMGLSDEEAFASIRFSLGPINTETEIDAVIETASASYRKLRGLHP